MLGKMLEYQKVEGKCIALENELLKSPDKEKATKMQQVLKKQHSDLVALENSAKKINERINTSCIISGKIFNEIIKNTR